MQQLTQNLKSGEMKLAEVPKPLLEEGMVLVKNHFSVISAGTEKSKIDLGKKNLLQKALARPDLVKQVWKKFKTEGFLKTYNTVNTRLEAPSPLGYSCSGIAEEVGVMVEGMLPGDRVACGGAGYANHSEHVVVPKNLVVKIPDEVTLEEAAFTTIGAIAMQGVRLAKPEMGEKFLVLGLGLIGQITVQLLHANGCEVYGFDPDIKKQKLAKEFGANIISNSDDLEKIIQHDTANNGVDGTIICAGTSSNNPIEVAGDVTRNKGRVVIVGAVGMNVPREPYFKKEISLVVSRSYGPGRYDPEYEEGGNDYPYAYVRFTEKRNMESFLWLVAKKKINLQKLITHTYDFSKAPEAYQIIEGNTKEHYLGILIKYPDSKTSNNEAKEVNLQPKEGKVNISCVGAGNYATSNLLPILKSNSKVNFQAVMTASGRTADNIVHKFDFAISTATLDKTLDKATDLLMVLTRHNTHADLTIKALQAKKHIYVEKPLAINLLEFEEIKAALSENNDSHLLVGFNRRFSPITVKVKEFFNENLPKVMNIRVNAGHIPAEHWVHDPKSGGGRIVGEVCHFVDLASALADSLPQYVFANSINDEGKASLLQDNIQVSIKFHNGSIANITYTSNGSPQQAKEYIEVFAGGKSAIIDDFKSAVLYEQGSKQNYKLSRQDKGQKNMLDEYILSLRRNQPLVDRQILLANSLATLYIVESLTTGKRMLVEMD